MPKKNTNTQNVPVAENVNDTAMDTNSKIDAIKQLIFGENMEAYNTEFETLKADLKKKKKELESLIEDTREELLKSIDNLSTDVNIRITELENTFNEKADDLDDKKMDRSTLSELLMGIGEKISK